MVDNIETHVAVCGGGLVGCVAALLLGNKGHKVEVFEKREDLRKQEAARGRSINLTLSHRGLEVLKLVGLDQAVARLCVPVYGRMIHDPNGRCRPMSYGKDNQHLLSVERSLLNKLLLDEVGKTQNVTTYFCHKVQECNFETGELVFLKDGKEKVRRKVDLIIGSDGAFSTIRHHMMKFVQIRFDYQQKYLAHGYMELKILPASGEYALEANFLHIWPRDQFMMMALPNKDKSFTVALFMPFEMFEAIQTGEQLIDFFSRNFADSLNIMEKKYLQKTFFSRKALPLISVKCFPCHVNDKAVLIGDAAHAMVPFYGQGMNCGFEDCKVLCGHLDKSEDLSKALADYSNSRHPNVTAMCDLSMKNYTEMRALVNKTWFVLRWKVDRALHTAFPQTWIPLYSMIAFSSTPYDECVRRRAWQDKVLYTVVAAGGWTVAVGVVLAVWARLAARQDGVCLELAWRLWDWAVNHVRR